MALKTFSGIRSEVQRYLGMNIIDNTTDPSLSLLNTFINDSAREAMSTFNFRQLEAIERFPFYHTINNIQGIYLSGLSSTPVIGSGFQATFIPYPSDGLLTNNTIIQSYSGIGFFGNDSITGSGYSGVSTQGSGFYGSINTLGYTYELPSNIDQIYSIVIPQFSTKLLFIPQYDIERALPNTILTASGTPAYYTEFPGMSSTNTKAIQFFPQPTPNFMGQYFNIHYKKMHIDMIADTDVQMILPEHFQDIIINATLEKTYAYLSDEKSLYYKQIKEERIIDLKIWAGNQLDYVYPVRDANFLGSNVTPYSTAILFRI